MLKQLSGLDSMFLYSENSRTPLQVGSLVIYDPSTSPRGKVRFKEVLATMHERLEQAGIFHRKVVEVPFSLDHPYWVEDENFDIEYHVRHIALPKPGDWRQLMIQVSRLQSRELDKARPLWEAYIIEGLDNVGRLPKGCFAVYTKLHHATMDGVSGAALQAAFHDLEPLAPADADFVPTVRDVSGSSPTLAQVLVRSTVNNLANSAKLFLGLSNAIPRLIKARMAVQDSDNVGVPSTVLNRGSVTANRVVEGRQFDLADLRAIAKSQPDTKINDVALAIVSGAMRKYLAAREDLPEDSLIAACPVNVRTDQSADADNMVSMMNIPLCTNVDDPVERLRAIVDCSGEAKEFAKILGVDTLTRIPMNIPAFFARNLLSPLMNLAMRFDAVTFNTIVSNVAGIQQPLYFCGARMVSVYGMGPLIDHVGLFHAVFSYDGKITFTITACREMLPDPAFYADCLQASFDELMAAALKPARRAPRRSSSRSPSE